MADALTSPSPTKTPLKKRKSSMTKDRLRRSNSHGDMTELFAGFDHKTKTSNGNNVCHTARTPRRDEEIEIFRSKFITPISDYEPQLSPKELSITEKLHKACTQGKIDGLTALLELLSPDQNAIIDINNDYLDATNNKCTLMHTAAKYQRISVMHLLWTKGSSVDIVDSIGATPIFYAASAGCTRACAFLLSKNAQVNIRDKFDHTPLYVALRSNHFEVARLMMLFKADIHFKVTQKGQTLLHAACSEGSEAKIDFLISNGASVTRTNREDETCLFDCLPHPHILKTLLQHVITSSGPSNLIKLLRVLNSQGETVVHTAVRYGHIAALLAIVSSVPLQQRPQLTEILNDNDKTCLGYTPLHIAVSSNHLQMVKLLALSQEVDMTKQNANGDTALHMAIKDQKPEMVYILRQFDYNKAAKTIKNAKKLTPKQLAKELKLMHIYEYTPNEQFKSPRKGRMSRFLSGLVSLKNHHSSSHYSLSVSSDRATMQLKNMFQKDLQDQLRINSAPPERTLQMAARPETPPAPTIDHVSERLDEVRHLVKMTGVDEVVLVDALNSFVRIVRLYINSMEKQLIFDDSPEQQSQFEEFKTFLNNVNATTIDSLTVESVEAWKLFVDDQMSKCDELKVL
ncbi:ANK1 [Acrasis kona]|uniref:ANK1 n=1 Tax=Acrasis kona TaxID=1008807 RepID=A0AAW2YSW4_9EUKA